jgi:hypothetical protein
VPRKAESEGAGEGFCTSQRNRVEGNEATRNLHCLVMGSASLQPQGARNQQRAECVMIQIH